MVAAPKNSKGKQVFHIKPAHMRKSIARDYLLEKMGAKRDSLLVAGDNMRRGGDDAAMFVCGGTNLLVGKGVRAEGLPVSNRLDNASALAQLLRRVAEKPLPE